MHSQPVSTVDEWITANMFWCKRLVKVRLVAKVQLGDASLGHNTAVVRLSCVSGKCQTRKMLAISVTYMDDVFVSLLHL